MNVNDYIKKLTKPIGNAEIRKEIAEEYMAHIEDQTHAYMEQGMDSEEAARKALEEMGNPEEPASAFFKLYKTKYDRGMFLWTFFQTVVFYGVVCLWGFCDKILDSSGPEIPNTVNLVIGVFLLVLGFLWSAYEKYLDKDLFYAYGRNWYGTFFSNSGTMLAFGLTFCSSGFGDPSRGGWMYVLISAFLVAFLQLGQRYLIAKKRDQKESELLWELGVAETEITYKGKANIKNSNMKVKTKGDAITPGTMVMVVELDGFQPVVISV